MREAGSGRPAPFVLRHGAWWLLPDGTAYEVGGFHEAWIRTRQDLVPGCRDTRDVVSRYGWIAVGVYAEGSVEFIVASAKDRATRLAVSRALSTGPWTWAIVMALDDDGVIRVERGDLSRFVETGP